jgi:hypothetical protein
MMKNDSALTDDESVLDISEQVGRPGDPILDPEWMIYSYLVLAAILIPLGEFAVSGLYGFADFWVHH